MGFSEDIKKVRGSRFHKFKNSYGIRDYYRHYCKTHETNLTEYEYGCVLRDIFDSLIEKELLNYLPICLPLNLGFIQVDTVKPKVIKEGDNYKYVGPVDWVATLKLWENDEEEHNKKTLVYTYAASTSVINYRKSCYSFKNQIYFYLKPARKLKIYIHDILINNNKFNIKNG